MQGLDENLVVGVGRVVERGDGAHQQVMGGVDLALLVEEVVGAGNGAGQPAGVSRVGVPRGVEQRADVAQVAGGRLAEIGGLREAAGPIRSGRAQLGGAKELADGAYRVAAPQVDVRDVLQQRGDRFVRPGRGLGEMPSPARVVGAAVAGQGAMDGAALVGGRQFHHRGTDQRVPEHEPPLGQVDPDQPCPLRRSEHVGRGLIGDRVHCGQIAGAVEHGDEQQVPGPCRQRLDPGGERGLEPAAQREHRRQRAGAIRGRGVPLQGGGQLQERERVALRLGEQALPHPRGHGRVPGREQGVGRGIGERDDRPRWQARAVQEVVLAGAGGGQQPDRQLMQTPGHEPEHGGAGLVDPRQVVDDQQQWRVRGRGLEHREHGVGQHKLVQSRPEPQTQCRGQGVAVPVTEPVELTEHRLQELVEGREADTCFELHTRSVEDADSVRAGVPRGRLEQHRLANARIAGQQQRSAVGAYPIDEIVQVPEFLVTSYERDRVVRTSR